tara:strand:- start:322 stop:789 length:468 start_codon:yes stop_codon:yes gene_type:complete
MKNFNIEDIIWKGLVFDFKTLFYSEKNKVIKTITTSDLKSNFNLRNKVSIKLHKANISLGGLNKLRDSYWFDVKRSLDVHGYDPKKFDYITVNDRNYIVNGYIRSHYLLTEKGNNYEIDVMVLKNKPRKIVKRIYWSLLVLIISIFFLFIYFITN